MDIEIAEMTIADYDAVVALWGRTEGLELHPDECDSHEGLARYLAHNPGTSFVARAGKELVAAVLCGADGRRGYMNHLAVAPDYRRRGIATAMVRRCMDALKQAGIPKCNLFLFAANEQAMAFYRALGWQCYDQLGAKAMTFQIP